MNMLRLSNQSKVRQCFQCQGDTEFYCNTCKRDLCLQCKEKHVVDLDTNYHDVVIYREKFGNISKQETCLRHQDRVYKLFCHSCNLPFCFGCKDHFKITEQTIWSKHDILDIFIAYETNREQHQEIIHKIRSEILYNCIWLLAGIKTDVIACHQQIIKRQSEVSTKTGGPKIRDTPSLTKRARVSMTEEINTEDVINLGKIHIPETRKRLVKNERLLKLMPTPVLHRSFTVKGVSSVTQISHVTSDQVWISDGINLILTNTTGEKLYHERGLAKHLHEFFRNGVHTVNRKGDLIFIDWEGNIKKLSKDYRTMSTLKNKREQLRPRCVYCSPSNGDLLIGMYRYKTNTGNVKQYNYKGQYIQTIQRDNTGQKLYNLPTYITENHNSDVIVSDNNCVVVTNRKGRHRFSYRGYQTGSGIRPLGICTEALSHILICDENSNTIQMLDKDGHFMSIIQTEKQGDDCPLRQSLSYDEKTHLLWVGSWSKILSVYRYINRQYIPADK
ncbi:uncharacterized protein LOC133180579 [Saccostrea echinata]|uniref:uncharacterized protein LOC133180579 n=1 Tax=Saccostrea echinata TaxID=191078 RepID=UPI002A82514F|nr:uncharacterized protein LOC133180579 [Saccostrea echinata]